MTTKLSDHSPVNIARVVKYTENAIHFTEKQSRRNRHGKVYEYDTYLDKLAERRERERVTGNREDGPL